MSKVITREEHQRNHRRRMRQALGLVVVFLVIVGAMSILSTGVGLLAGLFDNSDEMLEYQQKLEGFVMFDPLPFDGIQNLDDATLHSAAVWGCIYDIQARQESFDNYERDADTDQLLLPTVEVDAYLARIVNPAFKMDHHTFEMDDMTITYDETRQSYLIPITGGVGYYRPQVVDLFKRSGRLHVTVGYIPMANSEDITVYTTDQPTKYMDYLFERAGGVWYLVGLTESETRPTASEPASSTPVQQMAPDELEQAILANLAPESTAASAASGEAGSEAGSAVAASGEAAASVAGEAAASEAATSPAASASAGAASAA